MLKPIFKFFVFLFFAATSLNAETEDAKSFGNDLMSLVSIPSGSYEPEGLEKIASILKKDFEDLHFTVKWNLAQRSFEAIKTSENPKLKVLLLAHFDTNFKESDSFKEITKISDEDPLSQKAKAFLPLYRGPGIVDNKAGVVLIEHFFRGLQTDEFKDIEWRVMLQGDEEIGSRLSMPRLLEIGKGVDIALSFEPHYYDFEQNRPTLAVANGGHSTFEVQVTANPEAGLASTFGRGVDYLLGNLALELDTFRSRDCFMPISLECKKLPGRASVEGSANFAIRFALEENEAAVIRKLEELKKTYASIGTLTYTRKIIWNPQQLTPDSWVNLVKKTYSDLGEPEPDLQISLFRSAAYFLAAKGIPVIDGMGLIGSDYHTKNEWVALGSYPERLKFFRKLITNAVANKP